MRFQLISVAAIALATTVLLPHQALARTSHEAASSMVTGAVAPKTSVTEILPISYSLTPATLTVSSVAQQASQPGQTQQAQQQAQGERHASNWASWAKWRATRRDAMRWEFVYLGLSAVDAAQTIDCVHSHQCHEVNPIYGRHPSAARVILTKLAGGAFHFWLVDKMNKTNPWEARLTAQLSAGIQGFIVGINFTGALKDN